ncbi:MAG: hypothetical protein CFE49_15740 [Pseudomonas sp. PGPPP3]|nr:MAG: hypothetical protein CFE49_15740 [Pseudomonas sp. PGPPP3]
MEGIAFHRDGVVTDVNPPMAALIGRRREDMLGRHVLEFIAPDHLPRVRQGLAQPGPSPYEAALLDAAGQPVAVELLAREIHRDGLPLRMVVVRDIRDRQAARAQIQHLAEHDSLTGLRNRRSFMARLAAALDQHRAQRRQLALLFIDLDHFKRINDSYGHSTGDEVLKAIAATLKAQLRNIDMIFRFGGEEFLVVLSNTSREAAAMVGERLRHAVMDLQCLAQGRAIELSISLGCATLLPAESVDSVLRRADTALYAAKRDGRNRLAMAG